MDEINDRAHKPAKSDPNGGRINEIATEDAANEEEGEADYIPDDGENSFDDEATLEEEEALDNDADIETEVAALQEEQDIPVEELLRLYGYNNSDDPSKSLVADGNCAEQTRLRTHGRENIDNSFSSASSSSACDQDTARVWRPQRPRHTQHEEIGQTPVVDMNNCDGEVGPCHEHGYFSTSDEDSENDFDYVPDESWRKEIKVGPEHQADVPDSTASALDELDSADRLDECQWCPDPIRLSEQAVTTYLKAAYQMNWCAQPRQKGDVRGNPADGLEECGSGAVTSRKRKAEPPASESDELSKIQLLYLRDDAVALKVLFESHYDVDIALSAWKRLAVDPKQDGCADDDAEPVWKEDEQDAFEEGLKAHGKNFRLIREEFLPNRSTGELVRYYYLWKRTERHDVFVQTFRFEKRHCSLHPTATDYMDHFLDHMALVGASASAPAASTFHQADPLEQYGTGHQSASHHPCLSLLASAASSRHHLYPAPSHKGNADGAVSEQLNNGSSSETPNARTLHSPQGYAH